jgi:hypothetical protein
VEAALSIFDGGWPDLPEDEREGAWQDPLEGETPGRPRRTVDDLDEWKTDGLAVPGSEPQMGRLL